MPQRATRSPSSRPIRAPPRRPTARGPPGPPAPRASRRAAARRIPRPGGSRRRPSLDELPQLWNVLRGEMSLVGPRPPSLDEYEKYTAEHQTRLAAKPGITGLWQISARNDPSFATALLL